MEDKLTIQTKAAFERINDSLKHDCSDDLETMIYNLEVLLVRAKQIQTETMINQSGGFQ